MCTNTYIEEDDDNNADYYVNLREFIREIGGLEYQDMKENIVGDMPEQTEKF